MSYSAGPLKLNAFFILFGAQLAVGAAAIFARFALHGTGPLMVSALRLTIASVIVLFINSKGERAALPIKHELLLALCGLALAVHFGTWIASLLYTTVAVSTLLVSTTPVWTALFDLIVLKKQLPRRLYLAYLAGAVGVILIVAPAQDAAIVAGKTTELLGDIYAAVGAVAIAAYLIAVRRVSTKYGTALIVGRTYSWAALFLALAAVLAHENLPALGDFGSWSGIFAMALVSQLLGHTGINASLRTFSSTTVAFSTLLEPIFAAILSAMIFAERLDAKTIFGGMVVLLALILILKIQDEENRRELARAANDL